MIVAVEFLTRGVLGGDGLGINWGWLVRLGADFWELHTCGFSRVGVAHTCVDEIFFSPFFFMKIKI